MASNCRCCLSPALAAALPGLSSACLRDWPAVTDAAALEGLCSDAAGAPLQHLTLMQHTPWRAPHLNLPPVGAPNALVPLPPCVADVGRLTSLQVRARANRERSTHPVAA